MSPAADDSDTKAGLIQPGGGTRTPGSQSCAWFGCIESLVCLIDSKDRRHVEMGEVRPPGESEGDIAIYRSLSSTTACSLE